MEIKKNNNSKVEVETRDTETDVAVNNDEVEIIEMLELDQEFDLSDFTLVKANNRQNHGNISPAVLCVVNTAKSGKRIHIIDDVLKNLNYPKHVQIAIAPNKFVISNGAFESVEEQFNLKKSGKSWVIYSYNLVEKITSALQLDFSNRSCVNLYKVRYITKNGFEVAIISQ